MANIELLKSLLLKSDNSINLYKITANNSAAKNILIIGVFHGEEPQGFWAINDYFLQNKQFNNLNIKNNIYIIPCLNPDGMSKNIRQNANGVDLNRNFPTKNWEKSEQGSEYYSGNVPGCEDETKFLTTIINNIDFDLILTLHSPFAIVNYDGNANYEASKISELTEYPVQQDIGYPTPGSFGTYCGVERKIKTITLEFDDKETKDTILRKSKNVFDYLIEEY